MRIKLRQIRQEVKTIKKPQLNLLEWDRSIELESVRCPRMLLRGYDAEALMRLPFVVLIGLGCLVDLQTAQARSLGGVGFLAARGYMASKGIGAFFRSPPSTLPAKGEPILDAADGRTTSPQPAIGSEPIATAPAAPVRQTSCVPMEEANPVPDRPVCSFKLWDGNGKKWITLK